MKEKEEENNGLQNNIIQIFYIYTIEIEKKNEKKNKIQKITRGRKPLNVIYND